MLRADESPNCRINGKAIEVFPITTPTAGISLADVNNVRWKGSFAHQSKVAPLEVMPRRLQLSL
jgi:hypothetical protein